MTNAKYCKRCNEDKPTSEFYRSSKGYLSTLCKVCDVKRSREYTLANKERINERMKVYRKTHHEKHSGTARYRGRKIHENMVQRAARKGWPRPEFTVGEVVEAIDEGACEKTGIPFDFSQGGGKQNPWTPVPDRIDSSKPYTKDNVQWVCNVYNSAKNNWTDEEVMEMAKALTHNRKGISDGPH